eukprot:229224-Chlamydomonas_euryale.AAC.5
MHGAALPSRGPFAGAAGDTVSLVAGEGGGGEGGGVRAELPAVGTAMNSASATATAAATPAPTAAATTAEAVGQAQHLEVGGATDASMLRAENEALKARGPQRVHA